jgi:hypothetical protein
VGTCRRCRKHTARLLLLLLQVPLLLLPRAPVWLVVEVAPSRRSPLIRPTCWHWHWLFIFWCRKGVKPSSSQQQLAAE